MKSHEQFESVFLNLRPNDKHLIEMHNHGTGDNPVIDYFSLGIRDACGWFELGRKHAIEQQNQQGWIKCSDRMPDLNRVVALLNIDRYMNTGTDDFDCHWHGSGYLSEFCQKYWYVFGEGRAMQVSAVTHWMQLPPYPERL
ncbi:Protein of uncharacterised function (DUF551) [Yersinia frederiksenii]|nr:Protein of uncharacterised function (DUF551) [Yersinia frederiksenii]